MAAQTFARVLYVFAASLMRMPWPWLHRIGDAIAWGWRRFDFRENRVARRNLEIAFPGMDAAARDALQRQVMRTTARQALETLRLWTRPHAENLALIRESPGLDLFEQALASGRGVIVAAPHYGNWELLNQWLAMRTPLAILYKPPQSKVGETFLREVRADSSAHPGRSAAGAESKDRVTQVRAEGPAIRQLFKRLRDGGVIGVLPDQQPKGGDGEFAPFFGRQALTMTLLGRLAERSGARVLFAYCERLDVAAADGAPQFALRFEDAPEGIGSADAATAVAALNAAVEAIARRDPVQYQWTYKRFKRRPKGSGETNPYRDIE